MMGETVLGDAVIRIRLDPSKAKKELADVEKQKGRVDTALRKSRQDRKDDERHEDDRLRRVSGALRGVAGALGTAAGMGSASGIARAAGGAATAAGAGMAGAATFARYATIAGGIAAATWAAERLMTSTLPQVGGLARELIPIIGPMIDDRLQDIAGKVSELSAKITQFVPAIGKTVDMVGAEVKLGGQLPSVDEAMGLFSKQYKIDQAAKTFEKSMDRLQGHYFNQMLGRAIKGGS